MAATFLEAKGILRDARASVGQRRTEVEIERQKAKVEDARKEAATQMMAISQANVTAERIQEAEAAVNQLRLVLEAGVALTKKDREYNAYDKEVKKRIAELNAQIAGRKLFLSASEGKAALTAALGAARSKIEAARQPATTDAELEEAGKRLDAAIKEVETRAALEQQDKGYAAHADKIRNALVGQQEALEFAKQARELRKKTGDALSAGLVASAAAGSGELRSQKTQHEKALAHFKACKEEGAALVEGNPALAKVVVLVDGAPHTPKEVISQCGQKAEATAVLIKPLIALIAFDEGPKRAYEKAKALLAQGNKVEALAQFDECTATGVTLQYRNPELKDRQFEVAGLNISLSDLNKQCTAQSKTLRAK